MVHKLALLIGGVASVGVLALAIGAAGFNATASPSPGADTAKSFDGGTTAQDTRPDTNSSSDSVRKVVDKVYIAPTPDPRLVRVPNAPAATQRPADTATRTRSSNEVDRGERDRGENESADSHDGANDDHGGAEHDGND